MCTCRSQCLCTNDITLISSLPHTIIFPGSSGPEGPLLKAMALMSSHLTALSQPPFSLCSDAPRAHWLCSFVLWRPPWTFKCLISDSFPSTSLLILGHRIILSLLILKTVRVYCLYICLCTMCVLSARRGQKRALWVLKLELQMIMRHSVGLGIEPRSFGRGHLSSLGSFSLKHFAHQHPVLHLSICS